MRDGAAGWAVGFLLGLVPLALARSGASDTPGPPAWAVREAGSTLELLLDGGLRACGWRARDPEPGPELLPAGRGSAARVRWPGREPTLAPLGGAHLTTSDTAGRVLFASPSGELALHAGRHERGVLALGQLPGRPTAIAAGASEGTFWAHVALPRRTDAVAAPRTAEVGALALLRIVADEAPARIEVAWLRSSGLGADVLLAPVPGREEAWLVGGTAGVAVRLGVDGRAEGVVELPLSDPVAARADARGGLVVAFPGAVVAWDRHARPSHSRGGFDALVELRRAAGAR